MYLSTSRQSDGVTGVASRGIPSLSTSLRLVAANVWALGMVSLLTDVSAEMVTSVLPLYLTQFLGMAMFQVGLLDGVYNGASVLVRPVAGYLSDRWQRRKGLALAGYGLSALSKIGLLAVGSSAPLIGAAVAVDRVGKGLRTAPRDALISMSGPPETLGRSFGVHRAMDTVGALVGPLLATAILVVTAGAFDAVFVVSCCVAMLGLLVLMAFVRDDRGRLPGHKAVQLRAPLGLLRDRAFRGVCVAALPLSLATVSDAFLYLLLQHRLDFAAGWFTLLPVGVSVSFLLFALPLGLLADGIGRSRVFLGGYACVLGCYALLLFDGLPAPAVLAGVLLLRGIGYAATDGVLMAIAGPLLPATLRTSGLALLQTVQAMAAMAASWSFGAMWTLAGPKVAVAAATGALCLAIAGAWAALRPRS